MVKTFIARILGWALNPFGYAAWLRYDVINDKAGPVRISIERRNDDTHTPNVQKEMRSHTSNDHAGNRGYVASGCQGVDNLG